MSLVIHCEESPLLRQSLLLAPNRACQRTKLTGKILHALLCRDGGIGRRSGLKIHRPTKACEFESRSRHNKIKYLGRCS